MPPNVVVSDNDLLALVGGLAVLEFQIFNASPEVMIENIMLLFDDGTNIVDITADISGTDDILTSTVVQYNLIGIVNQDEGNYTLVASNPAGGVEATITLEVQGVNIFL